jgi:hypothetical protein
MNGAVVMTPADRFAIADMFAAYHWALDTGDIEAFIDTLVEHGSIELISPSRSTRFEGRSGMIDLFEGLRQWDSFAGCQHFSSQMRIEPLRTGHCRVRTFCGVVACRGEPPYRLQFAGRSDDIVVLSGNRWRFERRIVHLWASAALCNAFIP